MKGIIALDIDGTVTVGSHSLDERVTNYLNDLIRNGWLLVFITGRTFSFAFSILSELSGEFYFAVQNGASLYKIPQLRCLQKYYLPFEIIADLDPLFQNESFGLLVESGKENGDRCYFKMKNFSEKERSYLNFRMKLSESGWESVETFNSLNIKDFAVGKFFASQEKALEMKGKIEKLLPLKVVVIRDPFRSGYFLAHLNAQKASKGNVIKELQKKYPDLVVIAAGDDFNDLEMLEESSIKIVMKNAPKQMLAIADIIAQPASEQGIIEGLKEAIWKVQSK